MLGNMSSSKILRISSHTGRDLCQSMTVVVFVKVVLGFYRFGLLTITPCGQIHGSSSLSNLESISSIWWESIFVSTTYFKGKRQGEIQTSIVMWTHGRMFYEN